MRMSSAAGLAIASVVVALSGCGSGGGSGAAGPDRNVPLKERTTIAQFDVAPLPVEKAKPCDLIRPPVEEELGLVPPASMPWASRGGSAQTPTSCFWHNRVSEAVDLQVHRKPKDDKASAIRFALMEEHVDLIMGYPAGMLPIGSSTCTVTVGVSDTHYLVLQVQSRNRTGACALGVRAAQEALRNVPAL
ncbi:DUF3558 family protein [Streptomyces sp. NPDC096339]|uniref:DUF3558 family protein n=1 Tax=Streptomyces sp. NPDC096339 TaxID=3366086 RepID=UPI00382E0703